MKHSIFSTLHNRKKRSERGASMFEAIVALCFLCFFFFALLQIYQWCTAKIFTRYSAYYGAKGRALGYRQNIMLRAARVAAIPISGSSSGFSSGNELNDATNYMQKGDASGVWYRYWYPNNDDKPELRLRDKHIGDNIHVTVKLANNPLLTPVLGKIMCIAENPEPAGDSYFYNYSSVFLEDGQ